MTEETNNEPVEQEEQLEQVDESTKQAPASTEYDNILYKEDGNFNKEGTIEYIKKQEERVSGMRKSLSAKGEVVEDVNEYFKEYKAPEKYVKYFHEETPEDTKKVMGEIQGKLAKTFYDNGMNKKQANEVNATLLEVMEDLGVLDTRTEEQLKAEEEKAIAVNKAKLGSNADNLIREAKEFIESTNALTADVKNQLNGLMEQSPAEYTNLVTQLKQNFGSSTGGIPQDVNNLAGLAPDSELAIEYLSKDTTDLRRREISNQREAAGRTTKLMDALPQ